ncbi:hypothetical protein, partial [Pseudomonas palleroniana]
GKRGLGYAAVAIVGIFKTPQNHCGRGLAPDSSVPVSLSVTDLLPSGASPLPQGFVLPGL